MDVTRQISDFRFFLILKKDALKIEPPHSLVQDLKFSGFFGVMKLLKKWEIR